MKTGQIYIIKNKINDKVYIGQTTINYLVRFSQHCKPSAMRTRHYKLYNAIKKYGTENFYIELVEDMIPIENLSEREIYYIEKFDSFNSGYNSTKGGDGRVINKPYDEEVIADLYSKGVSSVEIGKIYNVCGTTICRALNKLNIKTRDNGNKYSLFDTELFIKMWNDKNTMIKDMAKNFNVHEKTIRRTAKRLKLQGKRSVTTIESLTN